VHDEDRAIDELGEPDDALDRLGFRAARVADGVVAGQGIALFHHAPREPRDHAVVLRVHHDQGAVLPRRGHHVEDLLIGQARALVRHEDLERAHTRVNRGGQIPLQRALVGVGDDEMKPVVDHRLRARPRVIIRQYFCEHVAAMLRAEWNHGGRAAMRRRHRRAIEVIRRHYAHRGELLDVAMAVDAARQHQLSRGIDGFFSAQACLQLDDLLAADADVRAKRFFRGDDGSAADHQIEGHARFCYNSRPPRP